MPFIYKTWPFNVRSNSKTYCQALMKMKHPVGSNSLMQGHFST